jgi:hypothetical protein
MDLDELLDQHTPQVAELCRRLLDHISAAAEWSESRVYAGWHGVGFHHGDLGYVVGVFPHQDDVRVVFERGEWLGQAPFLDGDGQTRHVDFTNWDRERVATVEDILDRALAG